MTVKEKKRINEDQLLCVTRDIVTKAAQEIIENKNNFELKTYSTDPELEREVKALADQYIEKCLITELEKEGLPILSEESGYRGDSSNSDYIFIIDPLDGTFNYLRGFGSYAISVALWYRGEAVFGVVYDFKSCELSWGGKKFGAFCNGNRIRASKVSDIQRSLVCTGFPVRYDMTGLKHDNFLVMISQFSKVRMIGSAALSIVNVAKGAADAYFEKNIMIWDVAAGIAIAEGAGAKSKISPTNISDSYDVIVSNNEIYEALQGLANEHGR